MKRILALFLLSLASLPAFTQFDINYKPLPFLDTITVAMDADLKEKLRLSKEACNESKSQVNSFLKSLYEKRHEYLVKNINDDLFMTDGPIVAYLDRILNQIYLANPALQGRVKVVAVRSEVPNAMSFGEGTIGITLGLLAQLKTDAQVAFVLSHEMAHYYASHSDQHLRTLARLNYDKELKKKIEAVKKSEYNQYSKMKEIFKGMGFSISQHSREHEHEADSLGFTYLINSIFNPEAALSVMTILDSVDFHADEKAIDFKKYFDFKSYPFKPSWTVYSKSTTWHASHETSDSLKTHPDCKRRMAALERQWLRIDKRSGKDNLSDDFPSVRAMSKFELVESLYHFKNYGASLFMALQVLNTYPENIYLQSMVGRNLYHLYTLQKNHEFGKATELPDSRFSDGYDRYLTFLHKLRLAELSALAYHYTTYCPDRNFADEEFMYTLWLVASLSESQLDPEKVKDEYMAKFPRGKFVDKMKPQLKVNHKKR